MTAEGCGVTIVTGGLGSGKTTLIRRLLSDEARERTAVVVNEFGAVGIDHDTLRQIVPRTRLVAGGCACCQLRDELVVALRGILDEESADGTEGVGHVVIETSGLADPAPIVFSILTDPVLQHHLRVHRVIATLAAPGGADALSRRPEAWRQLASADEVVLTKTDLVSDPARIKVLADRVVALNPIARVWRQPFDYPAWREPAEGVERSGLESPTPPPPDVRAVTLRPEPATEWGAFAVWLSLLLHARGEAVLRLKGLLDVGGTGPVLVNGVQHVLHPPEHLTTWPEAVPQPRLVLVVQGLEPRELRDSFEAFVAPVGWDRGVETSARS